MSSIVADLIGNKHQQWSYLASEGFWTSNDRGVRGRDTHNEEFNSAHILYLHTRWFDCWWIRSQNVRLIADRASSWKRWTNNMPPLDRVGSMRALWLAMRTNTEDASSQSDNYMITGTTGDYGWLYDNCPPTHRISQATLRRLQFLILRVQENDVVVLRFRYLAEGRSNYTRVATSSSLRIRRCVQSPAISEWRSARRHRGRRGSRSTALMSEPRNGDVWSHRHAFPPFCYNHMHALSHELLRIENAVLSKWTSLFCIEIRFRISYLKRFRTHFLNTDKWQTLHK